jgi:hypothetical protein
MAASSLAGKKYAQYILGSVDVPRMQKEKFVLRKQGEYPRYVVRAKDEGGEFQDSADDLKKFDDPAYETTELVEVVDLDKNPKRVYELIDEDAAAEDKKQLDAAVQLSRSPMQGGVLHVEGNDQIDARIPMKLKNELRAEKGIVREKIVGPANALPKWLGDEDA